MDWIDESFLRHLFIECYYDASNGLISECFSNVRRTLLLEKYGVFDGCEELAMKILGRIGGMSGKENGTRENPVGVGFSVNNNFISTIIVRVYNEDSTRMASYSASESKFFEYPDWTEKYDPLVLYFNSHNKSKIGISRICHELTHAYEDYNRYIGGSERLSAKADKIGYPTSSRLMATTDKQAAFIAYMLASFEQNAIIAEISVEASEYRNSVRTVEEAFKILSNTIPYYNYKRLLEWLEFLSTTKNEKYLSEFLDDFNASTNYGIQSTTRLRRFFRDKARKIERKFNNIIPKIVYGKMMSRDDSFPQMAERKLPKPPKT